MSIFSKRLSLRLFVLLVPVCIVTSCAKEMLPDDEPGTLQTYNKLYLTDAFSADSVRKKIYMTSSTDTTFFYSVTKGGGQPVDKDVNITFTALSQDAVDAFNVQNKSNYSRLPEGSYTLSPSTTLRAGESVTAQLPLVINKSMLSTYVNYVLPINFSVSDNSIEIDRSKETVYFIVRMVTPPVGEYIGNIPQLQYAVKGGNRAGALVFDFYGDLMLRDTIGNLWVYPLASNGNEVIGTPKQITFNGEFKNYDVLIFNDYYNLIMGISSLSGGEFGWAYSWPVTEYPNVVIGARKYANKSNWSGFMYQRWYSGMNGSIMGIYVPSSSHYHYTGLAADGLIIPGLAFSGGWGDTTGHKSQAMIKSTTISIHSWGLLAYAFSPATRNWTSLTKVGDGFYVKYRRIVAINHKDLIAQKYNGDIIRYKDFNLEEFYTAL